MPRATVCVLPNCEINHIQRYRKWAFECFICPSVRESCAEPMLQSRATIEQSLSALLGMRLKSYLFAYACGDPAPVCASLDSNKFNAPHNVLIIHIHTHTHAHACDAEPERARVYLTTCYLVARPHCARTPSGQKNHFSHSTTGTYKS